MQYTQDYDENLPLTTYPTPSNSWTDTVQPYIKNRGILRCPSDRSTTWNSANPRRSSYFLNAYMAGSNGYGSLAAVNSPASVIYLAESAENIDRDHFHPFFWGTPSEQSSGYMQNLTFDATLGETRELALRRHQDGFNVTYCDGHAKWVQWSRTWGVPARPTVWAGAFDPRQ